MIKKNKVKKEKIKWVQLEFPFDKKMKPGVKMNTLNLTELFSPKNIEPEKKLKRQHTINLIVGNLLKIYRKEKNLTLTQLSEKFSISYTHLRQQENCKLNCTIIQILEISKVFNVDFLILIEFIYNSYIATTNTLDVDLLGQNFLNLLNNNVIAKSSNINQTKKTKSNNFLYKISNQIVKILSRPLFSMSSLIVIICLIISLFFSIIYS